MNAVILYLAMMPKLIALTGLTFKGKIFKSCSTKQLFQLQMKIYKQIDGVAMGSHLGATLANAFLCFHEQTWLNEHPDEFKLVYYRRYVDEIFVLLHSPVSLEKFQNYLHSKH